ncbi:VirB4 family type IV secretion system protein [Paenibacillus sp. FSL L8-0709]|uniref:VirB4 family type IV secretion system protein n=1 Tax=Paenibacillus sp. FSL L8-0709 TaxID=2975312 RepID=UPI0030F659F4
MFKIFKKKKQKDSVQPGTIDEVKSEDRDLIFPTMVDNMLNEGINFANDHFEIQTGMGAPKYGRAFFLKPSGYPRTVRIGWLDSLFSGDDLDVSVHIDPLDRPDAIKKLQNKIDEFETVVFSAAARSDGAKVEDAAQKRNDTKHLQRQIKSNENGLYYVSIQATVYANSISELNEKCVDIERALGGESIEIVVSYGRQKEGFLSCLPLGKNFLVKSDRNLDQLSLTAIFPHADSKLNHQGGFPIGRFGRDYIYYNNFDTSLSNYSMGIFGVSGSGKSVLVKQIIGRGFMDGIEKNVIIDVEPEYIALTEALGGVVIPIHPSKNDDVSRINPMDIFPEKDIRNKGTDDEYIVEQVNINEKVKEMLEFYEIMKESLTPGNVGLDPIEIGILNDILEQQYINKGITEDPDSLFEQIETIDDKTGEIKFAKKYIEMPTISETYQLLEEQFNGDYPELKVLLSCVKLFTRGKAFGMFDGQTRIISKSSVSLDDAPVITFDISKLSSNGIERPLAQHVLMTWVWNRFIVSNPKVKKRIILDEAWMMIKYATMMEWLKKLSARGRKWNVSLTLVSQRYEMFDRNEAARDVVSQFETICFMKQSDQDIQPILDTYRLSEDVGNMIRTAATGEVIMKAGNAIVSFQSEPTPQEWSFLNTNQNIDMSKKKAVYDIPRERMIEFYKTWPNPNESGEEVA